MASSKGSTGQGLMLGLFSGGSILSYASPSGTSNNVNPGGAFPAPTVGRLFVDTTAGPAAWTGLVATPQDGMGLQIVNKGPNILLLDSQNAGSLAANQFLFATDLTLTEGNSVIVVYWIAEGFWAMTA